MTPLQMQRLDWKMKKVAANHKPLQILINNANRDTGVIRVSSTVVRRKKVVA